MVQAVPVKGVLPSFESFTFIEIAEGVAGPFCGLHLADMGSRVIKIEPPEGDRARAWGPPMIGDTAAIFCHLNRGKESVRLDLGTEEGRAALDRLFAVADGVIYHADPMERAEHGLDWSKILETYPRLIVVDINDLGEKGPFRQFAGSELVAQAMSGFTRYVGEPGGSPCRVGYEVAWVGAGIHAHQAMLAGLWHVRRGGPGQRISVSVLKSLMSLKTILLAAQVEPDHWQGFHLHGPRWPADSGWPTRDGQVTYDFRHGERDSWVKFVESIGLGHLADDPDYADWRSTIYIGDRRHTHGKVYEPWFRSVSSEEASARINGFGGISVKFNDYGEVLAHEQVRLLEPLAEVAQPASSDAPGASPTCHTQLHRAHKFSSAVERPLGPVPRLGEHTQAVFHALRSGSK
jgi:crotonobetainyl-CoA:carnitine CoA-transferase CaiB-like acyl-CoA transferase